MDRPMTLPAFRTRRRCGGGRPWPLAVLLACVLVVVVPTTHGGAAPMGRTGDGGGTPDSSASATEVLQVTSVSPWVEPEGTFEVRFSTEGLPSDSTVTITIHQRVRADHGDLRAAVETELDSGSQSRNLQKPIVAPLSLLDSGNGSARINIGIRPGSGDPDRQFIPNAGIHPVSIEVTSPGERRDRVVSAATVFLNRLPDNTPMGRDGEPARTTVQLLAGLGSRPTLGPDGTMDLSTEERLAVSAWERMLGENTDLPLTVALRPNTLLGLQRSDDPAEAAFVAELADTAFVFAPQTYVRVDAAGLAETRSNALEAQLDSGDAILETVTGSDPTGPWMLDDTVDAGVAERLHRRGVTHIFMSEDRFEAMDDGPAARQRTLRRTRTLALEGVDGMTLSSYDAQVTRILLEQGAPAGLRANRAATAMMASWFDAVRAGDEAFPGVNSAIVLSSGTNHDVLARLVDDLSGPGPLVLAQPGEPTANRDGDAVLARLHSRDPDVPRTTVDRWQRTARRIAGFTSMSSPGDTAGAELDLLNNETPALDADAATRNALWDRIRLRIDERLAMIQTPPPRSVVLTSRSGSIPLRFRNRGEVPVTVRLTTRSPRLDFPAGPTRDVLLTPGENPIDIPVDVQAPGSSLLRVEVTSPDGTLQVREVNVTVRSSSISGVGAALSIISLCILGIWWIRTVRARRRKVPGADADDGRSGGGAAVSDGGEHRDAEAGTRP